ncbi:MAG: glycoside hydrolase family 2 [Bacteroidetes bacterium]|nr:MAG: glycoside hydrolase family 2 [Bacteroidota bacterium]
MTDIPFKVICVVFSFLLFINSCSQDSQKAWEIPENSLTTKWAKDINPEKDWSSHPRPQLQRLEWHSLNGLWDYAITNGSKEPDAIDQGKILVPYPVESALSGVKKAVKPTETLWYQRMFIVPENWDYQKILLNFGAVDWSMTCWINGQEVGNHKGGFDAFSFDITDYLREGENEIKVAVTDPTNEGSQPVGKQTLDPGGIFYTAVTGIWQTVWLEPVNDVYFKSFELITDIDQMTVTIKPDIAGAYDNLSYKVMIFDEKQKIISKTESCSKNLTFDLPEMKLWHPDHPFLYQIILTIFEKETTINVDDVSSYFGMRKIHIAEDEDGFTRMFLNNEPYFQNGPLDQGYWPDGLYTPPSEEAIKEEIQIIKDMGFNMLRKHVKVEPDLFYYWCDKKGILVWQDMPNGDKKIGPNDPDIERTEASAKQFEFELTQMIKTHYNHPSIIMWVPFNEGWGQYETARITQMVKDLDPTRLVNNASGWTDRKVGDIYDIHNYPEPAMPEPESDRAVVLGEFGGISYSLSGHLWDEEFHWGYAEINDEEALTARYEDYYTTIWEYEQNGLSAAVYTQITDVESETNGLLTYDREITKIPTEILKQINTNNFVPAPVFFPPAGTLQKGDSIFISSGDKTKVFYTMDSSPPNERSTTYSAPIILNDNMTITAFAKNELDQSRMVIAEYIASDQAKPVYLNPYSLKYTGGGVYGLIDGIKGSTNFGDGKWQGFEGKDLEVVIELSESKPIDSISVSFLEGTEHWIFLPESIEIQVAGENERFESVDTFRPEQAVDYRENSIATYNTEVTTEKHIRFVKIKAKNIGTCPEWHTGNGKKAWVFVDEIVVK